ncbi:helix-turn-helix domain-containing protein [Streptomyces sp. NPDC059900]|uniref:helix-turn-helix domain-containing protein n=1 Tax=Streptomyces sp. NPDC059900 TaxID=3155816 RepID=UPI00343732E0
MGPRPPGADQAAPQLTFDITSLALNFPRSGVAQLLGISRNTVTAHLGRVQDALGLNLQCPRGRAGLALALAVTDLPRPENRAVSEHGPLPSADGLLAAQAATHHTIRQNLWAWIEAGTDARQTARNLGISRATMRARLLAAEQLLAQPPDPPAPAPTTWSTHCASQTAPREQPQPLDCAPWPPAVTPAPMSVSPDR